MKLLHTLEDLHKELSPVWASGKKIGFVPTMGALHEGHTSLLRKSAHENEYSFLSIFVNPAQFGPSEDFQHYPRTLEADLDAAKSSGVTHAFLPTVGVMYPQGHSTWV